MRHSSYINFAIVLAFSICGDQASAQTAVPDISSWKYGEDLPPACGQYVKAIGHCTANYLDYLDRVDPARAEQIRQRLDPKTLYRGLLDYQAKHGRMEVAVLCASPEFKQHYKPLIFNVVQELESTNSDTPECTGEYMQIR